jgi:glycosyl transferase family 87
VKILRSQSILLSAELLLGLAMVYYYHGLLLPLRRSEFRLTNAPPGNWSDLYPRWLGARELLLRGRNPYSPEVMREIQRGFYGRPLDPSNPKDPLDREGFAYPLYVIFLLAPLLAFPFPVVRAAFTIILFLLTLASIWFWLRGMRLRLPPCALLVAVIAVISSYPVLDGLHLQQLTLLVAALLAATVAALGGDRPLLAGVLLACSTIKPQLVFVLAAGLVLWALANWRGRKIFLAGFGLNMLLLLASAELLLPGWFGLWRQAGASYLAYVRPSLLGIVLGPSLGLVTDGAAVLAAIALFWRFRSHDPGSPHFNFLIVNALFVSTLVAPNAGNAKYNLVLLLPAGLWLFSFGGELQKTGMLAGVSWLLAVNGLLWQWLLALIVVFAVVILHHPLQREATFLAAAPEILVFFFPLLLSPFLLSALLHINKIRACR